jgi:hypothetical protein
MVKTQVIWEYPIATQEQKDANLIYDETLVKSHTEVDADESITASRSSLYSELQAKATELSGEIEDNSASVVIEKDETAEVTRHTRTRNWSDLVTAQKWIDFVLSKGAKSAVVVVEE